MLLSAPSRRQRARRRCGGAFPTVGTLPHKVLSQGVVSELKGAGAACFSQSSKYLVRTAAHGVHEPGDMFHRESGYELYRTEGALASVQLMVGRAQFGESAVPQVRYRSAAPGNPSRDHAGAQALDTKSDGRACGRLRNVT